MVTEFKEKARRTAEQLNVIDDILFRKMAEDKGFCEEVLSTILEKEIKVLEVTEQKDLRNLQGRSVILDALCRDKTGKCYNIEVQKPDNDDHQRRVRYNASCITTNFTKEGEKFLQIPDVIIVFISRFDPFKKGKTMYHVDRVLRETGEVVENGFAEIYVNAAVKDGSDVSELMEVFTQKDKYDFEKFPLISARKKQFKVPEKGEAGGMCTIVEEFAKEYAKEEVAKAEAKAAKAAEKAAAKAAAGAAGEAVDRLMAALNMGAERACEIIGITMKDYNAYKKQKT